MIWYCNPPLRRNAKRVETDEYNLCFAWPSRHCGGWCPIQDSVLVAEPAFEELAVLASSIRVGDASGACPLQLGLGFFRIPAFGPAITVTFY